MIYGWSMKNTLRADYSRAMAPYDGAETSATSCPLRVEHSKAIVQDDGAGAPTTSCTIALEHDVVGVPAPWYSTVAVE